MADLIAEVGQLLRETAATAVMPYFRGLAADQVEEKAPGELVTIADRLAEENISAGLVALLPGSSVVGEEGVAADPGRLDLLRDQGDVWLVDPIDGTGNFASGREPFAMMVALLRGGVTVASWVLDPIGDSLTVAEAGSGTYVDGVRIEPPSALPPAALRGAAMTWFFPDKLRRAVERGAADLAEVGTGQHCAGREYLDIVTGRQHFVLFWRTLPWDHVPGSLLVREAGGVVRRLDGGDYHPTDDRAGLLAAASEEIWRDVRDILLPGLRG